MQRMDITLTITRQILRYSATALRWDDAVQQRGLVHLRSETSTVRSCWKCSEINKTSSDVLVFPSKDYCFEKFHLQRNIRETNHLLVLVPVAEVVILTPVVLVLVVPEIYAKKIQHLLGIQIETVSFNRELPEVFISFEVIISYLLVEYSKTGTIKSSLNYIILWEYVANFLPRCATYST